MFAKFIYFTFKAIGNTKFLSPNKTLSLLSPSRRSLSPKIIFFFLTHLHPILLQLPKQLKYLKIYRKLNHSITIKGDGYFYIDYKVSHLKTHIFMIHRHISILISILAYICKSHTFSQFAFFCKHVNFPRK